MEESVGEKKHYTLDELDILIHQPLRLKIMYLLHQESVWEFVPMRNVTQSTSGNLSIQLRKLESVGYIHVEKKVKDDGTGFTTCTITAPGREAFADYITSISSYLRDVPQSSRR